MNRIHLCADFIGGGGRRLFALLRTPDRQAGECILVVPPFAEEMNKSRRLISDYAQHCCANGQAVLCVDLYGTGDSDGELRDARVDQWIEDLSTAVRWSASKGWSVSSVLGIRLGAILAARLARISGLPLARASFWQPVTSGARFMDQFLRVRVMASRLGLDGTETVADLRQRLTSGDCLEVAGYELHGALCADIDALELQQELAEPFPVIRWLDVVSGPAPGGAVPRAVEKIRSAGFQVEYTAVEAEPFWTATELVSVPALVSAS